MELLPAQRLSGNPVLPGDKSISHRAAILLSIAEGSATIRNFSSSEDCLATLGCMNSLGVEISQTGSDVTVTGVGLRGLTAPNTTLQCGNSGTTMRLLAGLLAGQEFDSILVGDESLSRRTMNRVVEPLKLMGASINSCNGFAPLEIRGRKLHGVEYRLSVASAQVKSSVLIAGLGADGSTAVIEPVPTRNHTELMLRWIGVEVEEMDTAEGKRISISGGRVLESRDIEVPSDFSSAVFFLVAATCLPGSELKLESVGMNPSRIEALKVLQNLGVHASFACERRFGFEQVADIDVKASGFTSEKVVLSGARIANLIDEIPVLAVLGSQLPGGMEIRDAKELRFKESDRISATVTNLREMNCEVEEMEDGMKISKSNLKGAKVDSFGDHRIAMAFAVAALIADGPTRIDGADCVGISFPDFFNALERITIR